jgi:hypothetical protein
LCMLGKCSTTESHPQSSMKFNCFEIILDIKLKNKSPYIPFSNFPLMLTSFIIKDSIQDIHGMYISCHFIPLQSVTVLLSLSFMILTLLKKSGQIFCRMSFNLTLSSVFLLLHCNYIFGRNITAVMCSFQCTVAGSHNDLSCFWGY